MQASESYSAVGGQLLGLHDLALDNTPPSRGASTVASVQHAADVFVVLRLGSKHGVDLVIEDRRWASRVGHLPEQVGGTGVHRMDRPRHQRLGDLQGPTFTRAWLRTEKGDTRGRFPAVHEVRVGNPERVSDPGRFGRVGDEPPEKCLDLIEWVHQATTSYAAARSSANPGHGSISPNSPDMSRAWLRQASAMASQPRVPTAANDCARRIQYAQVASESACCTARTRINSFTSTVASR